VSSVSIVRGREEGRAGRFVSRAIIRTRSLLLGAALVFAGLVGLTGWMSWDAHEATFQHARQTSENLLTAFDDDIKRMIGSYDLSLQAAADGLQEEAIWSLPPKLRDMVLFDRAATAQYLGSILVVDESGRILIDSRSGTPPVQTVGDRDYFLAQRAQPKLGLYISAPFLSRIDRVWEIAVSRRWAHPDGSFAGVVVGTIQLEFFHQLFDKVETGAEGSITFMTDKGTIISRKPFKEHDYGFSISDSPLFNLYPGQRAGLFEFTALVDGISRLYVYRQIGDYPLLISVGVPQQVIFAEWWQKTVIAAMATIGLALVAGLLGSLCFAELRRRSRAEREAADLAAQYKLLADYSTDVIIRIAPDGTRKYVSPSARDVLGFAPQELIGQDAAALAHPEDHHLIIAARERMRRGAADQTVTYRSRHADGRYIWAETKVRGVRDRLTGELLETVAVLRDISERKIIEERLVEAVGEAEQATLAKSQFLATMSHEIRTPLNGVLGFTDLLQRTELTPAQRQYVDLQGEAGTALLTIINDILDFSRLDAGKVTIAPAPIELRGLIESCVEWFRPAAEKKGLKLAWNLAGDLPIWVKADGPRLQQVLCNLLSNAIKFTRVGGVSVDVRRRDHQPERLVVAVHDSGIGIPADKLDLLFQRFSQIDGSISREFGGTGLGLAITQRLVELMGGEISVSSVLDRGSSFLIALPLEIAAAPSRPAQAADGDSVTAHRGIRILVAEDNPVNQKLITAILAEERYQVDLVANGEEAIRAVTGERYDLVLMDVQMPVMDGWQATREIRALAGPAREVPILALTAHVLPDDVARCSAAGMQGHVAKPILREDLLAAIQKAVRSRSPAAA